MPWSRTGSDTNRSPADAPNVVLETPCSETTSITYRDRRPKQEVSYGHRYRALLMRTTHDAPVTQAFNILRFGFVVLPLVVGIDKFSNRLADWERYLSDRSSSSSPLSASSLMRVVGVIELVAALLVQFDLASAPMWLPPGSASSS